MRQATGGPSRSQGRITFCERISLMQVVPGGRDAGEECTQGKDAWEGQPPRKVYFAAKVKEGR